MSWNIGLITNEVKIDKKCAKDLLKCEDLACSQGWEELDEVVDDGKLNFNPDHMEHMDFVWQEECQAILCKHKVKGDICFASTEGDNAGSAWGYRFDGKGNVKQLVGEYVWREKEES